MENIEAAAALVEMFGKLTSLERERGCVIDDRYSEAVARACSALGGQNVTIDNKR